MPLVTLAPVPRIVQPGLLLEDREVVVLILGLLVAGFVIAHLKQIRSFPWWPLPLLAAGSLLGGWAASVVEDFVAHTVFNTLEHGLYALHSVLLCVWAMRLSREPRT